MINKMLKYNEFLNEKLSDKLSGFDEESLKQQFIDGKIDYKKYIEICKQNNIDINVEDFKQLFLDGKIDIKFYIDLCDDYKYPYPTKNELHTVISNETILNIMLYYACEYNFLDLIKYAIENGANIIDLPNYFLIQIVKNNNIEALELVIKLGVKIPYELFLYSKRWKYDDITIYLQKYFDEHNISEKLSDKLSGFDEESLKQQFIDGKIEYKTYIEKCEEYDLKLPTKDMLLQFVNNQTTLFKKFSFAAQFNLIDKIEELLKTENITEGMLNHALGCTCRHNNLDVIKLLINNGATNFNVLLNGAIINNNIELVKQLLEYGFNVK